jgi:hypothetical protein
VKTPAANQWRHTWRRRVSLPTENPHPRVIWASHSQDSVKLDNASTLSRLENHLGEDICSIVTLRPVFSKASPDLISTSAHLLISLHLLRSFLASLRARQIYRAWRQALAMQIAVASVLHIKALSPIESGIMVN